MTNALASGIEAAIGGAYDAMGLTMPKGFKVESKGGDLIISAIDAEGITITEKMKDMDEASNDGDMILKGGVQKFLNKMNQ